MAGPSPEMVAMANMQARAALLSTAVRSEKKLGTFTETSLGRSTRIKLFNVGIITRLHLYVNCQVVIGTAVATASTKAPWNLINRVRVTDYDGTDRMNMSGFQAFILNSVRKSRFYGGQNQAGATAAFTNPTVPTAVGTASILFHLELPIAFDVDNPIIQLQDTRGAILAQTGVGELYLTIDWNSSLYTNNDLESVYSGGATSTVALGGTGIQTTVYQEFLLPQPLANGQLPLPQMDLMTVYELNGYTRTSDNLVVNSEKLIAYPNVRSVIGAYMNFVQGATISSGKLNTVRLIGNGNTILVERDETRQNMYQRNWLNGDLPGGAYFLSHREKPVETALWGNVQIGLTPNTVGASPYVEMLWESFFSKGQMLPGVAQGT